MHQYNIPVTSDMALTAATARTVLQVVTPSTRRCKVKEIGVSFASVSAADAPVYAVLMLQTTAGSGSSATTPVAIDRADPAALCSAIQGCTSEPTGTTILGGPWKITPVGGLLIYQVPLGDEVTLAVSTRAGLVLTAPSNLTGVRAYFKTQE